jgi:hypothetical protein
VTPPNPAYSSGHSTQSSAAAEVLTDLFGHKAFTDTLHTDHHLMPSQEPRTFSSFNEAAAEAVLLTWPVWTIFNIRSIQFHVTLQDVPHTR